VGEPHPPQRSWVDDGGQGVEEPGRFYGHSRVDEHRLLGQEHLGVDGQHADAGQGEAAGEDVDVGRRLVGSVHQ
jgi:hypothetical protein